MNVLFLVALAIALSFNFGPLEQPTQILLRLGATLLGMLGVVAMAQALSAWTVRRLELDFSKRFRTLARFQLLRKLHSFVSLVVFGLIILFVRWNSLVTYEWGLDGWIAIDELAAIAPYLIAEMFALSSFFDVDQAIRRIYSFRGHVSRNAWSRWQYLNFQFRSQFGIWLAASLLMTSLKDVLSWIAPEWTSSTWVGTILLGSMSVTVLMLSPMILRLVWQASPLPAGPLRKLLEGLSQDLSFRCSNILIWQTHGGVANAAITGMVPQLRYVLLSDALIEQLRPEEIVSVYGHEVGHIKHHHLSYYFGFIAASLVFLVMFAQGLQELVHRSISPANWRSISWLLEYAPLEIALLVPYVIVVFGYLSRRCERQADLYGSRAASQALLKVVGPAATLDNPYLSDTERLTQPLGMRSPQAITAENESEMAKEVPAPPPEITPSEPRVGERQSAKVPPILPDGIRIFVDSLERVAALNGMPRGHWTWRHGSIAQRVDFLERIGRDPSLADRYDQSVHRLRWTLALGLLLGIAALYWVVPV